MATLALVSLLAHPAALARYVIHEAPRILSVDSVASFDYAMLRRLR